MDTCHQRHAVYASVRVEWGCKDFKVYQDHSHSIDVLNYCRKGSINRMQLKGKTARRRSLRETPSGDGRCGGIHQGKMEVHKLQWPITKWKVGKNTIQPQLPSQRSVLFTPHRVKLREQIIHHACHHPSSINRPHVAHSSTTPHTHHTLTIKPPTSGN